MLETISQTFITVIFPLLITYAVAILKREINKANNLNAIQQASNIVFEAVIKTQQVFVDNIKKEGKFDAKTQERAALAAKETARELLTQSTKKLINDTFGDLEKWLDLKIEVAVNETKAINKSTNKSTNKTIINEKEGK